jgi:hypothetical protein
MKKFHVEFDVETTDRGFQDTVNGNRLKAYGADGDVYPVAIVPADATITETTQPKEGYYYDRTHQFLRKYTDNFWYTLLSSGWRISSNQNNADHLHDSFYVGPLRDDV